MRNMERMKELVALLNEAAEAYYQKDTEIMRLEEAEQLILEKRTKEAERHIKKFDEEPELEILNGRYGPYIAYKGNNYKIPKDIVPQDLSLKSCFDLIKIQDEKGPGTSAKGKRTAKKK